MLRGKRPGNMEPKALVVVCMEKIRLLDISTPQSKDVIEVYRKMAKPEFKSVNGACIPTLTNRSAMINSAIGEAREAGKVYKYFAESEKYCLEYWAELRVCLAFTDDMSEVLGAISYEYPTDDNCKNMRIGRLGATGKIKGVGTELLRFAADQAISCGVGFHLWANPEAHPFYLKAGLLPVWDDQYNLLCNSLIFMGMKLPRAIDFAEGRIYRAKIEVLPEEVSILA